MTGSAASDAVLATSLQFLKGVGPRRAVDLAAGGLQTLEDLLLRLPLRYEDRSGSQPIGGVRPGDTVSLRGEILSAGVRSTRRRGFHIFELLLGDRSGQLRAVFFNQRFLKDVLTVHDEVVLFGTVERRPSGGLQLTNPQYEHVGGEADDPAPTIHTGRIVPVYERIGSVTPKLMRRIVHHALTRLPETLVDPIPEALRRDLDLPGRRAALRAAHFPPEDEDVNVLNRFRSAAQRRLIFEEFFVFQVGLLLKRRETDRRTTPRSIRVDDAIRRAALRVLPFRLTSGQRAALGEIVTDLQGGQVMNRLLQGDVGSGKTIVAVLAALVVMENGYQVAVMSPTELLAEQHFATLGRLLAPSRFAPVRLTGALGAKDRRETLAAIASGDAPLVVGTHALVEAAVRFDRLGLVIIDEQHRFGVIQRARLREKGLDPDVLVMTATPIPRTLALTAYGDLDTSVIRDLPPGRQPVRTRLCAEAERDRVYGFVRREIAAGRQAYVVYPLVEESEKLDLRAATEMGDHLSREVFPDLRVAVVHGRLPSAERDVTMAAFAAGDVDVLVATTVVEVGVDVPNASVIVIEHAERFGLAQLHQLRGRVGRGRHASHCLLLHQPALSETARARLAAVAASTDGFALAEVDLELRGPGDFFGTRQSGVPTLRVGHLVRDHDIMEAARGQARAWLGGGSASAGVLDELRASWAERFGLVGVG